MSDAQGRPEPDPPTAADAFAAEEAGPVPAGGKVGDEEADGAGGASQAAGTGEEVDTDSAAEVTLEGATAAEASLEAREVPTAEELRVRLLGRRLLALGTARHDRLLDVIGTALITVVATLLRVVRLGVPNTLVFDETFYVKDAWTLWRLGFEARWPVDPNPAFEAGEVFTYLEEAAYVVHPQVGKWLIGLGIDVGGGATNPAAWRLGNAIIGILAVFIVIRLARRLFASTALGLIAGGLMAIDGTSIVHSRVALLDQFLMFFSLLAFYLLVIDRQWARHRLAERTAVLYAKLSPPGQTSPEGQAGPGGGPCLAPLYGPRLGFRYWRLLAGVSLGLAVGTKWSGLYVVAGFGLLTVLWDFTARRAVGIKRWWSDCLLIDAIPAFFAIVGTALLTYLLTWWAWWVTPGAWGRSWAADNPGQGISWLPEVARSFVRYHEQMWGFHTGLTVEHAYMANPLGFIVQWRPTSFHWRRDGDVVSAITSIGNPLLWWAAALAGVFAVAWGAYRRDWRALAVLSGTLAGWLPWLLTYARTGRTMFTFYTIAITPWVVLTLVYAFAVALEWSGGTLRRDPPPGPPLMPEPPLLPEPPPTEALPAVAEALPTAAGATEARRWRPPGRRTVAVWTIASVLALIALISALFYPLWTAIEVPWDYWRFLIRFSNWV